jgi:hypothetical protein
MAIDIGHTPPPFIFSKKYPSIALRAHLLCFSANAHTRRILLYLIVQRI